MRSLGFAAAALVLLSLACTEAQKKKRAEKKADIVIGSVGSLTGPLASYGTSAKNGVDLAVAEKNAEGGVAGRKLRAAHLDDQGRPEEAKMAAQRLVTRDKVHLLLGAVDSAASLEMAKIAERARVPMITPSSTLPAVTKSGSFIFRVCFVDSFQGYVMARFARSSLKLERVAILRGVGSEYSVELANVFKKEFETLGGKVVADESFVAEDSDLSPMFEKVKKSDAQAVYVPSYDADINRIAPAAREMDLSLPLLGGDGWDSERLLEESAAAVEGSYFSSHFHPDEPRPEIKAFREAYVERYNEVPDAIAALAYDAARVAIRALVESDGGDDSDALQKAIADTKDFAGVTGRISFDGIGNANKPAVVMKIAEGKRAFVESVPPR